MTKVWQQNWLKAIKPTKKMQQYFLMNTGDMANALGAVAVALLLGNIPTLILLAIYWAGREKLRKRSELDKMQIDDL